MADPAKEKYLIWMNMPSHHQADFFSALRQARLDVIVCYYEQVSSQRRQMGWTSPAKLPDGEHYVPKSLDALRDIPDWRERIHVHPGYASAFLRALARHLSREGVRWVHWSEPSRSSPALQWWLRWPLKRRYARLANRNALGVFGQGSMAIEDFTRWGIQPDRTAMLFYAVAGGNRDALPDPECASFCAGRPAFLFMGGLQRRKGIDLLLKAYANIARLDNRWTLLLAGPDSSGNTYAKIAKQLKIDSRLLFLGSISPDRRWSVLQASKVLLLPSRFDGWGVVVNEAASMGRAIIASNRVGASYHLVEPGCNGFRVAANSVSSLTRAMFAYTVDAELADRHGQHSLSLFSRFTPEANVARFLEAIRAWTAMRRLPA